jgi:uncharacterized protein DUF3658/uncharacterized protein DUF1835
MMQTVLHIVFTVSGAGCLRQALSTAGRNEKVISSSDDLRIGPIAPDDRRSRARWMEAELGWTEWDEITASSEQFWKDACRPGNRKIAWLSRRSGRDYTGFLEWLWRLGEASCEVIDLTEVTIAWPPHLPHPGVSLASLPPDVINDNNLCDLAKPLPNTERKRYLDLWRELRAENAPLRVVAGDLLRSAPISFFDPLLMSQATDQWRKVAMIVGSVLAEMDDHLSDIFLAARVNALVKSGQLEIRGKSALQMRHTEVKLPTPRGSRS